MTPGVFFLTFVVVFNLLAMYNVWYGSLSVSLQDSGTLFRFFVGAWKGFSPDLILTPYTINFILLSFFRKQWLLRTIIYPFSLKIITFWPDMAILWPIMIIWSAVIRTLLFLLQAVPWAPAMVFMKRASSKSKRSATLLAHFVPVNNLVLVVCDFTCCPSPWQVRWPCHRTCQDLLLTLQAHSRNGRHYPEHTDGARCPRCCWAQPPSCPPWTLVWWLWYD